MDIQQLHPKIIPISKIRRDIDVLNKVLDVEQEVWVTKNQKVLFVAVKPERYKHMKERDTQGIDHALQVMDAMRAKHKAPHGEASAYVVKMRDERIKKWKK